jgi:hypothetical protein
MVENSCSVIGNNSEQILSRAKSSFGRFGSFSIFEISVKYLLKISHFSEGWIIILPSCFIGVKLYYTCLVYKLIWQFSGCFFVCSMTWGERCLFVLLKHHTRWRVFHCIQPRVYILFGKEKQYDKSKPHTFQIDLGLFYLFYSLSFVKYVLYQSSFICSCYLKWYLFVIQR